VNTQEMYERDNHMCLACGTSRDLTTQHRINRQAGGVHGDAAGVAERASARITLCLGCNRALEADARFARTGRQNGWKLEHHEDPTKVAVYVVAFREWRQLDDDGSYRIVDDRDPQDMTWDVAA